MSKHLQSGKHPDADQISAFVDHALPSHERDEMLEHLAECADCREMVALSLPVAESLARLAATRKSRSWLWSPRLLWPATAAAMAMVLLLYVYHSTNSKVGNEEMSKTAAQHSHVPAKGGDTSASPVGGGGGSSSFGSRENEVSRNALREDGGARSKQPSIATGNRLAAGMAGRAPELHSLDGAPAISMVARGRQILAINDRNELLLSNDGGATWIPVRVPWKGRAVKTELVSYSVPAVSRGQGAGSNPGEDGAGGRPTDAAAPAAQNGVHQELKGSSLAAPIVNADAPKTQTSTTAPDTPSTSQGALTGVITDRAGAVISGASIAVTNPATHESSKTEADREGRYRIEGLAAGTYQLECEARGFKTLALSAVQIAASSPNTANITLDVGASAETVMVQSATTGIESHLPELGSNAISRKQKSALPTTLVKPGRVFMVTTDTGDQWTSADGVNWHRQ